MTSEHATPAGSGAAPDLATLAKVVARQRAELDRLRDLAAASAVVERAKGAVMALSGCSAQAAGETLLRRAEAAGRTLLEESWITLGDLDGTGPLRTGTASGDARPAAAPPGTSPGSSPAPSGDDVPPPSTPGGASPAPSTGAADDEAPPPSAPGGTSAALGRLARALVHVGTPQGLARCLLKHLATDTGADAVLLYARPPSGGLELIGHAGIDETLAAQWHRVPPLRGLAALDALRDRRPRWLENVETDRDRYLLMGEPPERWRSRAWLPVAAGDGTDVCLGVLRRRAGPFPPADRERLKAVALLCAGRLRTFGPRPERAASGTADDAQRVLDALPVAAMLLTPLRAPSGEVRDYRVDAATEQAADVVGRCGGELVGRRLTECLPPAESRPVLRGCLHTLLTGEPYEGAPFAHQKVVAGVAELSTYSVRVAALDGGLVLTWIRHDSSDRQEQRLADLQRLGNLGWAAWNLSTHEATWSSQVFAIFGRDPARGPVRLADLPGLALPDEAPALERAVQALTGQGQPLDMPFRTRTPAGVRHLRFVAEAVTDIDGAPVEVLGFVQDLTALRRAELALVESERAMLTQHDVLRAERTLAARLQDALLPLPRRPLEPAGLRVEVAYLPAQAGVYVGGDWFSAIELPDGDALFVVGDVAGHGVDAVATMAQLRFTAKGMVITGSSLTGALARLNTLLLHSRGAHGTASMVLARYKPEGRRLVWAQAGHPPPLLLRDGRAVFLDRPSGIVLGATTTPVFKEAECRLRPGDRLLLYTDGLVERPPENIDRGLERLAKAATAPHHLDEPGPLDALLATMLEGKERRDDVCVLDIRVPGDTADEG